MRSRSHHETADFAAPTSATPGYPLPVSSLDERIKEVCTAREMKESEWLRLAGVSHALFSSFRTRLAGDAQATITVDKLQLLADAAGVNIRWLWKGEGPRDVAGHPREYGPTPPTASGVAEASPAPYERQGFTINVRVSPGRVPELRFGSLVEWPSLLATARTMRDYDDEVWGRVADAPLFLPAPPSAEMVAYLADAVRACTRGEGS